MSIEIVARFYFEGDQARSTLAGMFCKTKRIFRQTGGQNIRLRVKKQTAYMIASFLDENDPSKLHHGFESKIIRPYPDGCGAGELVDATSKDLKLFQR